MPKETDKVLEDVLGWAKGIALAAEQNTLDADHVLLGAIKCREKYDILNVFFQVDEAFGTDMQAGLRKAFENVSEPITTQKLKLSPRLDKIIEENWRRYGGLKTEELLKSIKDSMANDILWTKHVFRNDPSPPGHKIEGIIEALNKTESLQKVLSLQIIGQDLAIDQVCDAFFYLCFRDANKSSDKLTHRGPAMLLTFLGPSGVGKTFMAELIEAHLSDDKKGTNLLRLDMSAYAGHQAHEQLVGFNAAYSNAGAGVLTGFIKSHPDGVVLADEIEKAHRNTQNIFLQILDYGKIYENNTKESIDCSGLTVIFTTNLGRELYSTPEKFGLLQNSQRIEDVILDALGKDVARQSDGDEPAGLSPEMLSRLAKGHLVLFERLDGLALERIAQKTVEQVSAEIQNSAGIRLEVGDPILLTLMVLRFGTNGDARRLTTGLRNYLYSCIKDMLFENKEMLLGEDNKVLLLKVNGLRIVLPDVVSLPDPVKKAMEDRSRILVIDEDQWTAEPVDNLEWHRVGDVAAADELLRAEKVDYILLDLNIGTSATDPGMDKGLEILRWIRTHYPEVPLYVFSETPERRKLSPETLQNVAREGGARGVLQKLFYGNGEQDATNRNAFFRQLKEIDAMLRRERLLNYYRRHLKTLEFDLALRQEKLTDDGYLKLELTRVREIMAVAAKDRTQIGWVDIPTERFADIAGARHAKDRLMEISKWLANPGALRDLGLELPKGILLTGPPGTGKTSLARAVAGESQVPFFAISGSDVFKKWAGESEATIRHLFARAHSYAPSIIFIDEIDGIGGKRSVESGNDYRAGVLNQLLAQMDGFAQEPGRPVFVMAATNRPDILDSALLSPGRFDLQIEVPPPSPDARKEIFELYMKKVPKEDDISTDSLVARSAGMSGAEIRQVCKEAAWLAYREGLREGTAKTPE